MRPRTHHLTPLVPLALLAVLAGGCTASGIPSSAAATTAPTTAPASAGPTRPVEVVPSLKPVPPSSEPVTGEVPPAVMASARAELARSVGAEAAASATVVKAEAVDWPDGSAGCPQPGMLYPQVITPGYQVVFEVDGEQYDMHATASGGAFLCESGRPLGG